MKRYASLIPIFVLPVIIAVYLGLFWNSVKNMAIESSGYPKLLIVAIACLLPFVIWREIADWLRRNVEVGSFKAVWVEWRKVVYAALALVAYVVLMDPLGAYASSALFVGGLAFMLGYRRPLVLLGLVLGTLLIVYVFAEYLGVELPGT